MNVQTSAFTLVHGTFAEPHYSREDLPVFQARPCDWSELSVFELAELEAEIAEYEAHFKAGMDYQRARIAARRAQIEAEA